MLAVTSLIVGASRPAAVATVPVEGATVILDIDVSRKMCSRDIGPSRLQAAEAAAALFIQEQKPTTEIGVVAFAGFAELIQPPTTDKDAVVTALRSLLTGSGTAIGSGLLASLDAIAGTDKAVAPSASPGVATMPRGADAADIVVLLTDGVNDTGPLPLDAAREAAARGVRVYTVGFGTANGNPSASCQSSDPSGLGGSAPLSDNAGGRAFPRGIDETTLRRIAAITGGAYYPASSSAELESVFNHLTPHVTVRRETYEVSVAFVIAGALLATIALILSMIWRPLG